MDPSFSRQFGIVKSLVFIAARADADYVAECTFTSDERERIDAIAFEFNETIDEFFADARYALTEPEWRFLTSYAAASIRRALELSPLLHAVVDRQSRASIPYPGRGRESFVQAALSAWRDSFAPVPETWRLAPICEKVQGGESRVLADVNALEVIAAGRMLTSLDEHWSAFFAIE